MMRSFVSLAPVLLSVGTTHAQSTPVCVSHFQNTSNFQWSLYNFDGQKTYLKIEPNTTIEIPWGTTNTITVSGNIPNRPYIKQFTVQPAGSCVSIQSSGGPGAVILNKPNGGDITTCSGNC